MGANHSSSHHLAIRCYSGFIRYNEMTLLADPAGAARRILLKNKPGEPTRQLIAIEIIILHNQQSRIRVPKEDVKKSLKL